MEQSTPRGLSSTALKLIAITTMFIDHIGAVLIEGGILNGGMTLSLSDLESFSSGSVWWKTDLILRLIGRIAFPIFAFLLVEGFLHTRDIKKYGTRLLLFGFLSEIPFDLAVYHTPFILAIRTYSLPCFLPFWHWPGYESGKWINPCGNR